MPSDKSLKLTSVVDRLKKSLRQKTCRHVWGEVDKLPTKLGVFINNHCAKCGSYQNNHRSLVKERDRQRAMFESWVKSKPVPALELGLSIDSIYNDYAKKETCLAWWAWQASRKANNEIREPQ